MFVSGSDATAPTGFLASGRGWLLGAVGLGWFATLGLRLVVPALLPAIRLDLNISNTAAGIAITLIWITYGGMQFPAGTLIHEIGERRLLTASTLIAGISLLVFWVVPGFSTFLFACALFGLGTGLYGPARATVISREFPTGDAAAFGAVLAGGSLGAAALPLVAGGLSVRVGWRSAIGAFTPLFLLSAVWLWWSVPRREWSENGGVAVGDLPGALRSAIGQRAVLVAASAQTLMLFGFQGLTAFLPTYLVIERGMNETLAAGMLALVFASGAGFQFLGGRFADRWGHHRVLLGVAIVSVLPLLALPYVTGVVGVGIVAVLFGVRTAVGSVSNSYVVRILPESVRGTAWGFVRTIFFVVGATGSIAVGAMGDRALFDEAFLALAALTGLGAVLYYWLPARETMT